MNRTHAFLVLASVASLPLSCTSRGTAGSGGTAGAGTGTGENAASASSVGQVTTIVSVKIHGGGGVEWAPAGTKAFSALRVGSPIAPGSELRTAEGVQARLLLRDGTVLHLNEKTTLQLHDRRQLALSSGELLAEVAPGGLGISTANSTIRVTGTKLNVKSEADSTTVDVTRGTVEVASRRQGGRVEVGAGERAVVKAEAPPRVTLSQDLAEVTRWSREVGTAPPPAQSVQPGIGSLEARAPGQGRVFPLHLARHEVRVVVQDNMARTEVEQEWYNGSSQTLEGTYRFPIPAGASISRLALYVGNRLEEGEIVERQRARQIFRQIVEDTVRPRDPALLEWIGGRTFQMKIFPIPPRGSRRVVLAYTEPLSASYGRVRYEYPMSTDPGKTTTVGRFGIDLRVASSRGEPRVKTPLYPTLVEREGDGVRLRYEASDFRPAASFVANIVPVAEPPELLLALYEPPSERQSARCAVEDRRPAIGSQPWGTVATPTCGDQGGFFMATLRPELPTEQHAKPRDFLFLLDSSYSTGKHGWSVELAALEAFLAEMDLQSRFTVMACDATCRVLSPELQRPTAEARQAALRFARGITPGGSSNLQAAFEEAAGLLRDVVGAQIVYFGDGRPTAGELREPQLARMVTAQLEKAHASFTALQIGEDVGELFLSETTRRLGGAVHRLGAGDDVTGLVFDIVAAQYRPTLTDLEVTFDGLDVHHLYPRSLESLTAGSEAIIVGRYSRGGEGAIRLRGRLGGKQFERRYPVRFGADGAGRRVNSFIPRLWAKHHLDALSVESYAQNRPEIVRVSKAYTVLSRATAFLVLENERMYREFGVTRKRQRNEWDGRSIALRPAKDEAAQPGAAADKARAAAEAAPAEVRLGALGSRGKGGSEIAAEPAAAAPTPERSKAAMADALAQGAASREPEEPNAESKRDEGGDPDPVDAAQAPMSRAKKSPARAPRVVRASRRPPVTSMPGPASEGGSGGAPDRYYRAPRMETKASIDPLLTTPVTVSARRTEDDLRQRVAAEPLRRSHHLAFHRALVRNGSYEEALRHAEKWAEVDGMHAEALAALADMEAARGDSTGAMRTFASTVEIEPWNARHHQRLADMYRNKGDVKRSCAHLWSLVSLAPSDVARHMTLARCIADLPAGREQLAPLFYDLLAQNNLSRRDAARVAAELRPSSPGRERPPQTGALVVQASWDHPIDLDLTLITPRGERISALNGSRLGGTRADSRDGRRPEMLVLTSVPDGSYRLEIQHAGATGSGSPVSPREPVSGTLMIRLLGKRQVIPFLLAEPSKPLAQLTVSRRWIDPPYRR